MAEKNLLLISAGALVGIGIMAGATMIRRWWRER